MKSWKWMMSAVVLSGMLAGCSGNDSGESTQTEMDTVEEAETADTDATETEETELTDTSETDGSSVNMNETEEETGESVTGELVLSKAYEEASATAENNPLVQLAEDFLAANPNVGEEGLLNVSYSGQWYEEEDQLYGVFLLTNRTGMMINDMDFRFSWAYEGQPIVENQGINYRESDMNTLPENASILLLIPVDPAKEELVKSMSKSEDLYLSISHIEVLN
ncbi:hypothetical protein [Marinilactibacillus sp. Marseille-P9653]|uniref:hypothetical protein n=1 Tax=Marinilactibacillus sp. Marseille-P9653 TaxID=2866583 RepID=UPI001CE3D714|nr:hypothetical protein [Marinilactibacillus sp. Marseille-P9653]